MKSAVLFPLIILLLVSIACGGSKQNPTVVPPTREVEPRVEEPEPTEPEIEEPESIEVEDTEPVEDTSKSDAQPSQNSNSTDNTNEIRWAKGKTDNPNPNPFLFQVINQTSADICQFRMWPDGEPIGQNLLGGPLKPGQNFTTSGGENDLYYWIVVVDCNGNSIERNEFVPGIDGDMPHTWTIYSFPG